MAMGREREMENEMNKYIYIYIYMKIMINHQIRGKVAYHMAILQEK